MGAVVGLLALAVAGAGTALVARMRRAAGPMARLGGLVVMVAGVYVAWYGWYEIRLLGGRATGDPIVSAAVSVQAALTRAVSGVGTSGVAVAAGVVALAAVVALVTRARVRP
jgi:cytochrome c-type biogenesis protein